MTQTHWTHNAHQDRKDRLTLEAAPAVMDQGILDRVRQYETIPTLEWLDELAAYSGWYWAGQATQSR